MIQKDSSVTFDGLKVNQEKEIIPSLENQVAADWLDSIGGIKLIKFVGQEHAKDLEETSLFDLQEVLGQQEKQAMNNQMKIEVKLGRIKIKAW